MNICIFHDLLKLFMIQVRNKKKQYTKIFMTFITLNVTSKRNVNKLKKYFFCENKLSFLIKSSVHSLSYLIFVVTYLFK